MNYNVKFVYMDGKDIDVPLKDEKLQEFFSRLNGNMIYWTDESQKNGFWLNMDKIRYIQFQGIEIEKPIEDNQDEERKDKEGQGKLPCEISSLSGGEGDAKPA